MSLFYSARNTPQEQRAKYRGVVAADESILDVEIGAQVDPGELVRAAMEWHFNPETGSAS
jgi:hypothetical protein